MRGAARPRGGLDRRCPGGQAALARGDTWSDYRAIVWHSQKAGSCAALKELGIDAVAVIPEDRERPTRNIERRIAPLRDCGLRWYVENIATDFIRPTTASRLANP